MERIIKLKEVYNILENSIDDLIKFHQTKNYNSNSVNSLKDLERLKFLHPEYSGFEDNISQPAKPITILKTLDKDFKEYRPVSEPELIGLFTLELDNSEVLTVMGLNDWDWTPLVARAVFDCPEG